MKGYINCGCNKNSSTSSTCSCQNDNNDCCQSCDIGKFTYIMISTFLQNGSSGVSGDYPQIWDSNGDAIQSPDNLVLNDTYYVVFSHPDMASLPPSIDWQRTAYAFIWSCQMNITVFGDPQSTDPIGQFTTLVGYINDRIYELCLPCCIKDKMVSAIVAYVNNQLVPNDGDNAINGDLLHFAGQQQFNGFCNDLCLIPKCGPIYVYHAVIQNNSPFIQTQNANINYVMQFLNMAQFYLRSYYSTKCCCDENHIVECKCKTKYLDVCNYVFSRICVIDVNINSY